MLYGVNLLLCAISYTILQAQLIRHHGHDSRLATAVKRDFKGKVSLVLYVAGIAMAATYSTRGGIVFYVIVALLWLVPDRRIERVVPPHSAH